MSALVPVPGRDDRDVCYATFLRSFLRAIRTRQDGGLKFKIIVCGEVALESCCSDGDNAEVRCTHSGANDCMLAPAHCQDLERQKNQKTSIGNFSL